MVLDRIMENLLFLMLIALPLVSALPPNLRGVSPQDEKYYEAATIWCKDGSKIFPPERLNDDFCDCVDGTDEPGTSACPNGKFYCKNKGHTPLLIFSSRVNDGICDCCDGSDEYDGRTKCPNTCSEAGKASTEKLQRKIGTFKGGLEVRKRDVENAKNMIQKEKVELSNLKQEEKKLKDVVQKLKAKKEAIEKAEMQEQLQLKKEEEKRKADMGETKEEAAEIEGAQLSEEMPDTKDVSSDVEQSKIQDQEKSELSETKGTEKLSKEELGRLVASRWTGEDPSLEGRDTVEAEMDDSVNPEDDLHNHEESFIPDQEHGYAEGEDGDSGLERIDTSEAAGNNAEEDDEEDQDQADGLAMEDEDEYYDNEDADEQNEPTETTGSAEHQDAKTSEESSLWTKLLEGLKSLCSFTRLPVDKLEADRVRKQYGDATSKLSDIQSKISDLEKKLEQDFGKDGEFYSLYDQCFELQQNKYVYKVCPYRHALQVEGRATTTLGNWDGFRDDYKVMQFVRGDRCWNGPDRSVKVKLRCGVKIELMDVDEPSRCEYVAVLSTPAVCLEEKLKALQERLKNRGDDSHDEL